ncbi:Myb-like DNA-binding domain containing protein [Tritrichomonas foetus]|uniref:Myb-like DNA-binding domain containing protein n=1 Tax=Tritrichomonas foetus TaxID=1144522 RepID=A0A1J4KLZ7_9EUKA|nr:Myb-like DNA-binding domain containing protein [Tritrichomonas foetus]|eukprot:OHT10718.1 Myb-like DNA-binding domain containing protein [Tritrichomonas foetus]
MKFPKKKFTPEEDAILLKLVDKIGAKKWDTIALSMPGRKGRQCRDRYMNYLSPEVKNDGWTADEDLLLIQKVQEYGTKWSKIRKFFERRTASALKNRWNFRLCRIQEKRLKEMISSNTPKDSQTEDSSQTMSESDDINISNDVESSSKCSEDDSITTKESFLQVDDIVNVIFCDMKSDDELKYIFSVENNLIRKSSVRFF